MEFRRSLSLVIGLTLVSLFVVACGKAPAVTQDSVYYSPPTPRIIEHPEPRLASTNAEIFQTDWQSGDRCLRNEGGIFRQCVQVRVHEDGTFRLISTQEELMDLFAPIESPEEALSYALLATGYSAKYDPGDYRLGVAMPDCDPGPEGYYYYVDTLEDTHVVEIGDGYEINLFDSQEFGCAPHPVWSVTVQVNYDGVVTKHSSTKLFEEGSDSTRCCVD